MQRHTTTDAMRIMGSSLAVGGKGDSVPHARLVDKPGLVAALAERGRARIDRFGKGRSERCIGATRTLAFSPGRETPGLSDGSDP